MTSLDERLTAWMEAVDRESARLLALSSPALRGVSGSDGPAVRYEPLYDMHRYHLGWLDESLARVATPPGKKLRPALCLLVAESVAGDWQPALAAATAVELVHNFSLIHDDIEDHSPTRRFRPTVWSLWGMEQGINAGDALLIVAEQALLEAEPPLEPALALDALRRLNRTCRALCEGQYLDMLWEHEHAVSVEDYLEMIERKTARLFQCAAELGAACAGAPSDVQAQFAGFAATLGLAFQAADDLLGIWSPESETGKPPLDVASRKKTLPILLGLSAPPSPVASRLWDLFALDRMLTPDETSEATAILEQLGAREQATARARSYRDAAQAALAAISTPHGTDDLREFVRRTLPSV